MQTSQVLYFIDMNGSGRSIFYFNKLCIHVLIFYFLTICTLEVDRNLYYCQSISTGNMSESFEKWITLGERLGFEGEELQNFVLKREQEVLEREERASKRQMEK